MGRECLRFEQDLLHKCFVVVRTIAHWLGKEFTLRAGLSSTFWQSYEEIIDSMIHTTPLRGCGQLRVSFRLHLDLMSVYK